MSIAQHIVYFNQNVDDQAMLGWEKVLLAKKMTTLNYFCQRCSARKKEKTITNKPTKNRTKNEPSSGLEPTTIVFYKLTKHRALTASLESL